LANTPKRAFELVTALTERRGGLVANRQRHILGLPAETEPKSIMATEIASVAGCLAGAREATVTLGRAIVAGDGEVPGLVHRRWPG
jgi:hypothetical protein